MSRETLAVLDFETTALSPNCGDRAAEIAIRATMNKSLDYVYCQRV